VPKRSIKGPLHPPSGYQSGAQHADPPNT